MPLGLRQEAGAHFCSPWCPDCREHLSQPRHSDSSKVPLVIPSCQVEMACPECPNLNLQLCSDPFAARGWQGTEVLGTHGMKEKSLLVCPCSKLTPTEPQSYLNEEVAFCHFFISIKGNSTAGVASSPATVLSRSGKHVGSELPRGWENLGPHKFQLHESTRNQV